MKIWGGLGNQLFQYALGRKLAKYKNVDLKLDITFCKYNRRRPYCLNFFNITGSIAKKSDILNLKLLDFFYFHKPYNKRTVIKERQFNYDPAIDDIPNNAYLAGYWQNEKYFKEAEDIIRQEITLKNAQNEKYHELLIRISSSNSVSVHVRRTDYLTKGLNLFTQCLPEYYHQATALAAERVGSLELFVFSDDMEWVKRNISFRFPVTFVSDGSLANYQELMLMSSCKHNIMANSTFSWWAAWLNQNPQKMVFAPKKWFIDDSINEDGFIPQAWFKL